MPGEEAGGRRLGDGEWTGRRRLGVCAVLRQLLNHRCFDLLVFFSADFDLLEHFFSLLYGIRESQFRFCFYVSWVDATEPSAAPESSLWKVSESPSLLFWGVFARPFSCAYSVQSRCRDGKSWFAASFCR